MRKTPSHGTVSGSASRKPLPPRLSTPNAATRERVHGIWDRLADFDAAQVDGALTFLLQSLCALVGAQNADWFGVVRLPDSLPKDPVHGWRPPVVHYLHPSEKLLATVKDQTRKLEFGIADEVVVRMVGMSGHFRACRLRDIAPAGWFDSAFYREYYRDCGHDDAMYIAFPVNNDVESYFGLFRATGQPAFAAIERDAAAYALRGLKWFHRQLLLSHGLLIAETGLTPVERRVLKNLLTGLAEKQIAAELGQSYHTTHEYVTTIYRKFGVGNRAALMALWLGRMP
jgi:DNA-binding CsgD family transcriptional regulator